MRKTLHTDPIGIHAGGGGKEKKVEVIEETK